ncbi:PEGA domain-containing protein [Pyxidicoccus xibeiensis]|uniref:PEGA domain-containing protein n=1 Tax=Pyxidicoccus xibeiensis TaxID=2906759 RepID=UPI0020A76D22|nr:PEGA domain-containing protein [Pyxidicoccus xibeiensis]MCP3137946.1 PEGA domain-containing protein [Pyxidicoccus xibeiensis]
MSATLLVMSLLLSASAPVEEPRELDAALQALSEGDFEAALSHVDKGLQRTREEASEARLHLVRGEVYAALRQYTQMEAAFAQALESDPDVRLDPERVQPTVVTLFESLRERLRGELVIDVEPAGADLRLDGQPLGQSPWRGPVPIGTHTLDVGSGVTTLDVTVRPGRVEQVRVVLPPTSLEAPSPSGLAFGAQVRAALGLAPLSGVGLEAGGRLAGRYLYGELNATAGRRFGASARLGVQAPELVGPVTLFLSLDGYALAKPGLFGAGVSAGASLPLSSRLALFAELSGRWLPSDSDYETTHLLGVSGLRFTLSR